CDNREGGHVMSVPVAFNYLRRNGRDVQAKAPANFLFDFRSQVRACANCSCNLADGHFLGCLAKTRQIATILVVPIRNLQPERDGLRVNTVSTPNLGNVLELPGAPL